ncbi:MAG: hypothetical protein EXR70_06665 [Deltaproteobacteria bacterium]|nr:hypothetical protein [Deltaproteobacteria bacterium]
MSSKLSDTLSIVVGALALLLVAAPSAQACSCAAPAHPAEALKRSTAVFSGRVVAIDRPFLDRLGVTNSGSHRVKFEIRQRWKGAPAKNAEVVTRLSGEACGFPFAPEQEYLV